MQRGARFAFFCVPFGALCWAQRGCQKRYKTNAFFAYFEHGSQNKGALEADAKEHNIQKSSKK